MRILVYPHSMELGGSQLNAVELAAAVRDRGHEVVVYAEDGPLREVVHRAGLELVVRRDGRVTPSPARAAELRGLLRRRAFDVVHGYEWPPVLEAYAAAGPGTRTGVVATVMSMSVAPFLPRRTPLFVGTERIREHARARRPGPVLLMEPPVDTDANRPGPYVELLRDVVDLDPDVPRVVLVSRLARELKLEGILTAVRTVGRMARRRPVVLLVVGDGPARADVERAAEEANRGLAVPAVVLTGQLADPRPAYDAADACIGMGGSALRSLAFGKPLVVQGEGGFFETLTADTLPRFLRDGWYGVADRSGPEAEQHLARLLEALLDDAVLRKELGELGAGLVHDRFSLTGAAAALEDVYAGAASADPAPIAWVADGLRSGAGLVRHKAHRRVQRVRGHRARDDFNARPL